jgi:PKD repeat protein
MNFKTFTFLTALIFAVVSVFAQNRTVNEEGNYNGVIRVKLDNEMVNQLEQIHQQKGNVNVIKAENGFVLTSNASLDAKNQQFGAYEYKRVFRYAGKFEKRHREWGLHRWYEISFSGKANVDDLVKAYQNTNNVEIAEPLAKMELYEKHPEPYTNGKTLTSAPNDPKFTDQWHYENTGQNSGTVGADISLLDAWTIETGDSDVIVAVEDGGIDVDHPDLIGNMWINPGEIAGNGIDDDNNGYVDDINGYNFGDGQGTITQDDHGTHVAGTIAAETNNGIGVSGIAGGTGNNDGVRIMSCQVFGSSSQGGFDEAFVYAADMGAHISQNSWGGGGESQAINNAIDYFIANGGGAGTPMNGGVVIVAAGNSNTNTGTSIWPAAYENAIAVAATNKNDKKSYYSNYGTWVDISAPGGELESSNNDPTAIHSTIGSASYGVMQGTSMACPHVSGVAALIVSKFAGNITPAEVRSRLLNYTDDISALNTSYSGQLGSGRLNAYASLTGQAPPPPAATYCTSAGSDASYEWIAGVQIGSFTNTTGTNGGYADFTSQEVELAAGQSYNITLTPGFKSSAYNEYWKIWIDFNNDTVFDSNELVFDAGSMSQSAVTGTISIPSYATGTRRMRVSMKYNGEQTACESFSYGEVEDYHAVFGQVVVDPPVANFTANTTTITEGGSVAFTDLSTNNPTAWSWSFAGGTPSTSSAQNPTVTYNTPGTYQVALTATNAGGSDGETKYNYITVEAEVIPAPVANFSANTTTIAVGGSVSFTDQSTNNPTAWSWSFAGGTPSTSSAQNPTVTYNTAGTYQVSLTASNAGGSDSETKASYITVEEVVPEYCASKGNNVNYEWIAGVEIGSFTNNTGANGGYADFTAQTVELAAGQNVNVKFTPGFASSSYSEYWTIWIDYNKDYDFDDAGEQVYTGNGTSIVNGSFTVASGASGTTRMRVTMKYNGAPTPCETFSYGEVEDYTVTFGSVVVVKPVANFTANTTSIEVGQSVSFSDLSTNDPNSWSWSFAGGTPSTSSAQNPTVTYNTAGTYQVSLTASNSAGSDTETKSAYITVTQGSVSYCASQGNNSSYEWIEKVQFGSFTNTSGNNGGYEDFTNMTINLTPGASEAITLTPGFSGSTYQEYWIVWIDYNKDGDFTDAGEQIGSGNGTGVISGNLTIDANATGTTRMRVTMKYNAAPTSCETFTYGEVEDYTVSFGAKETTGISEITQEVNIYPQPADNMLHIEMTEAGEVAEVVLYNMSGQAVKTAQLNNNGQGFDLNVSAQAGGIYMLQIVTNGKVTSKRILIK